MPAKGNWLPFKEARKWARAQGLKSREEWKALWTSGIKPDNIPYHPERNYKNKGWCDWNDWLGVEWMSFQEAREWARAQGLKSGAEWKAMSRAGRKPPTIPASPDDVYKDKGWSGWGDWLATGNKHPRDRDYLSFEEARAWVRAQGLGHAEWRDLCTSGKKSANIPSTPDVFYKTKGWNGWGDWFGTATEWMDFEEAREWARAQGLKKRKEWYALCTSGKKPENIPANPLGVYKTKGWDGWSDWLGTKWMDFEEAREWARAQGLKSFAEWQALCKAQKRPQNIPSNPNDVYKDKGWSGMGDWLGVFNLWTRLAIVAFLRDIQPHLVSFEPVELYKIMQQNGMLTAAKEYTNSNHGLLGRLGQLAAIGDQEGLASTIDETLRRADEQTNHADEQVLEGDEGEAIDLDAEITAGALPDLSGDAVHDALVDREDALPTFDAPKSLDAVDLAVQYAGPDEEACEFFIANAVGKLWRHYLRDEASFDLEALVQHPAGEYGARVRERFLEQLHGARNLPLPEGYRSYEPNLMQRLIAYRLLTERRLGNWSGTGAGKTLGAILASRVVGSMLTVVVGLNSTIENAEHGWAAEIRHAFPKARIIIKERGELYIDPAQPTFVLLNFESFQLRGSVEMIRRLVEDHQVDTIVLDEIHSAKQRGKDETQRRENLMALLGAASQKNPDLCVLGMSATPVINNLKEARSLLEMIRGCAFIDLETRPTVTNVMRLHEKLVLHGVRYKPRYKMTLNPPQYPQVPGDHLTAAIARLHRGGRRNTLELEQALLPAKLPAMTESLAPGTLVYTQFVEGMVPVLVDAVRRAGYSAATYVGDDKREDGFNAFVEGRVDVLVASEKIQQGVDGLQERCNRLIIACAPWTGAGYEQLIGRIYRQGSVFEHVDVIIPQVVIPTDTDDWSYDQWRYERILSKKTLADATVDGVIPDGLLESPESLVARSLEAIQGWIKRLEEQGLAPNIERPLLRVPLPPETVEKEKAKGHWSDFSTLNGLWATWPSSTTHKRLGENPTEWYAYHTLYREARQDWPEVPYETIAKEIAARPDWVVGDFGCGEDGLAALLGTHCVHSFDHVAINDRVTACDMAHTPLPDNSLDVAVFSLSLMGTNWRDYIAEAYRVLKPYSWLRIAEPLKNEKCSELIDVITGGGFRVTRTSERDRFLYIEAYKL